MGDGYTHRVCQSCKAVATTERLTCDHCGELTVSRVTRATESDGKRRSSFRTSSSEHPEATRTRGCPSGRYGTSGISLSDAAGLGVEGRRTTIVDCPNPETLPSRNEGVVTPSPLIGRGWSILVADPANFLSGRARHDRGIPRE